MSKSYEYQGKNVEKAIERASGELNISPEKIKYEVLTYGSSGIFGLVGIKKAKIKVFVDEKNNNEAPLITSQNRATYANTKASIDKYLDQLAVSEPPSNDQENHQEMVDFGLTALQTIIDGISEGASITSKQTKEKIFYSVNGGDSGVLIGKRGQTLEAIQYLLEKMVNKKTTKKIRVMVDVEGYLEKRKNNLKQLASRMAEKAKKIKKPVTIGQMNAHDRRIVHIHLKDENGIRTQSVGDGYYRKLIIFPKKRGSSKGRSTNSKV